MGLSWTEILAIASVCVLGVVTSVLWIIYGTKHMDKKAKYVRTLRRLLSSKPKVYMLAAVLGVRGYDQYMDQVENAVKPTPLSQLTATQLYEQYRPNIHHLHNKMSSKF